MLTDIPSLYICHVMLVTETIPAKKIVRRGPTRFRGIGRDAKRLKVTRVHLWFVLTGARVSPRLMSKYRALHPDFSPSPERTKTAGKTQAERRAA
jgi:hypothetical protein